jgi:L-lactate dehydrogenase complex protein LldG
MTSSRDAILASLRANRPTSAELPLIDHPWTTYPDPLAKFTEVLDLVGGHTIIARNANDLNRQLSDLPQVAAAQKTVSLVPGVSATNVDLSIIDSPHALADIDVAILSGEFAVAENAAVWVTDRHVPLRVLFFLCQHLILVVDRNSIVDHMHAAYERLQPSPSGRGQGEGAFQDGDTCFSSAVFGAFISGPSKTADIEQSLVIGAHGPRSLVVCFLDEC